MRQLQQKSPRRFAVNVVAETLSSNRISMSGARVENTMKIFKTKGQKQIKQKKNTVKLSGKRVVATRVIPDQRTPTAANLSSHHMPTK